MSRKPEEEQKQQGEEKTNAENDVAMSGTSNAPNAPQTLNFESLEQLAQRVANSHQQIYQQQREAASKLLPEPEGSFLKRNATPLKEMNPLPEDLEKFLEYPQEDNFSMEFMNDFIEFKENEERNYRFTVFREKTVKSKKLVDKKVKIKNPITSHIKSFLKWEEEQSQEGLRKLDRDLDKFKTPCLAMNTFNREKRQTTKPQRKNALKSS